MPERVGHSKGGVGLVTPNFGNNSAPVGWCVFSRMLEGAVPGSIYVFVGLMSNPGGEVFDMHFHITLATTAPALVFRAEKNQRRTVGFLTIGAGLGTPRTVAVSAATHKCRLGRKVAGQAPRTKRDTNRAGRYRPGNRNCGSFYDQSFPPQSPVLPTRLLRPSPWERWYPVSRAHVRW